VLLVHPYRPDADPRTVPTWTVLRRLGPPWQGRILHICSPNPSDYDAALRQWWGRDDLVTVQQDIEPSVGVLGALGRCPHPLCAVAYPIPHLPDPTAATLAIPGRSAPPGMTWAHRVVDDPADPEGRQRWIDAGEEWADLVDLGCARMRRGVQESVPPDWGPVPATVLGDPPLGDLLSRYLYGRGIGPWHIHWPAIPHHHGCACHPARRGDPA